MQSRRKRPKKDSSRMDAALENMQQYGFSHHNVRLAVKDLLKVYGEDGWVFIEESAYNVLLETLLQRADEEYLTEIEYENGNNEEENQNLNLEDGQIQECGNGNREEEPKDFELENGEIQECGNGSRDEPENLDLVDGEIQECGNGNGNGNGNREEPGLEVEDGDIPASSHSGDECDKSMIVDKGLYNHILEEMSPLLKEDSRQATDEASYGSFPSKIIMPMNSETRTRKRRPCYGWIEVDE